MNLQATWGGDWTADESKAKICVLSIHHPNDRLLDAVAELIGSPNVLLHHTKANIKPPWLGAPFPMHQDYPYFPYRDDTVVAAFINLDDTDPANGGLAVFPGSHKLGPLENKSTVPTHYYVDQDQFPLEKALPICSKKGQVIVFSYLLVHGSHANTSNRNRRMLLAQLVAAEDEPLNDEHISPCHGLVLRGANKKRDANHHKSFKTSHLLQAPQKS